MVALTTWPRRVGLAGDGALEHRRVLEQGALHLEGADVVAELDHIVVALANQ